MVGLRGVLVSFVLLCLQDVVQTRHLHGRSSHAGHHERLLGRQTNTEPPRCPPKSTVGKSPALRDNYNVPDANIEQIEEENLGAYLQFLEGEGPFLPFAEQTDTAIAVAAAEVNATETSSEPGDAEAEDIVQRLRRRQNSRIGAIRHAAAALQVPTNGASYILYTDAGNVFGPVESRTISTSDLCGCTVFVVSSPFATMMLHVLERRADDFHMDGPGSTVGGAGQAQSDAAFVAKGRELLLEMLRNFGTTTAAYRQYFPLDTTVVAVVAPAANPDYLDWEFWRRRTGEDGTILNPVIPSQQSMELTEPMYNALGYDELLGPWPPGRQTLHVPVTGTPQNPVSTHPIIAGDSNKERLVYPSAAKVLLQSVSDIMIPGRPAQAKIFTYRRRYNNDPNHKNGIDDREFVAVEPFRTAQGTIATIMYYDDDKFEVFNRL